MDAREMKIKAAAAALGFVEDGMRLARTNLSLYANFFPPPVVDQVRVYYGLAGFP